MTSLERDLEEMNKLTNCLRTEIAVLKRGNEEVDRQLKSIAEELRPISAAVAKGKGLFWLMTLALLLFGAMINETVSNLFNGGGK
jgi:hypothetical protein